MLSSTAILDELLYEHGAIATNLAFAEIKRRSLINPAAKLADPEVDFFAAHPPRFAGSQSLRL